MTDENKKYMEDLVKQGMDKFALQYGEHINQTVKGAVNHSMGTFTDKFDAYVKSDMEWKEKAKPMFSWFDEFVLSKKIRVEWLSSASKIGGIILIIIALVGALWQGAKLLIVNALR